MSFTIRLKPDDIHRIDQSDMGGHISRMAQQIRDAVQTCSSIQVPITAEKCKAVIVLGMGGSAIGGDLVRSYLNELRVPFVVNRSYTLPEWVNEETLVIASSYSGNTEETLSAFEQASEKKLPILCISTGGKLAERAKALNLSLVTIPGGMQPRAAIAYSFVPIVLAMQKIGLAPTDLTDTLGRTASLLDGLAGKYGTDHLDENNAAFKLAGNLLHRIPVIYTAVGEEPIALRWRGQIQENAKHIAFANVVPEMNHNEIEGWAHPIDLVQHFATVLLRSKDEHPRISKRFEAVEQMLSSKQVDLYEVEAEGETRMERMFSLISVADWTSYYMALFAGIDPTSIDAIEDFKKRLSTP